ncbi:cation:proton antiporter [Sorangium sp. So ce136]|uniref:cation:proton antiporter n=1 Tax=Sorangium sp. So ce136 TaxID=3133284 RepID=UPI003F030893
MLATAQQILPALVVLASLVAMAHVGGRVFTALRQPRVIGEIVGGVVLGPTCFGALAPELSARLFSTEGAGASLLAGVSEIGLLLLMFCSGAELGASVQRSERRTVTLVSVTGLVIPVIAALLFVAVFDTSAWQGPARSATAFVLVFAIAIAVASIPVISRIMLDLGILDTPFARIVVAVAVIEDVVLYVALAVALGLVQAGSASASGLAGILGIAPRSGLNVAWHVGMTFGFLGLSLTSGPGLFRDLVARPGLMTRTGPILVPLALLASLTAICGFLGVTLFFGAFIAGIIVRVGSDEWRKALDALRPLAFGFFIPAYFARVGYRLDLRHALDIGSFLLFVAFACAVKATSVYMGARLAGEGRAAAVNLSVALNARGGPGIVLASVAFDAAIVNDRFYTVLVLLAILTSLFAGAWLQRELRAGRRLR